MAYRPFPPPPQSTFAPASLPNQNALQPPGPPQPPPGQGRGNQYSQNWGYSGSDYAQIEPGTNYQHYNQTSARNQMPPPPSHHQQQYAPPLPPPDSSYPPPPPPPMPSQPAPAPPMYYPTSQQYSQYSQQQPLQPLQPPPPPPPSSPPPNSAVPPPPPSSPPPPPSSAQSKESRSMGEKVQPRDRRESGWRDPGQSNQGGLSKQHKPLLPPVSAKKSNGPPGRVETEEERRSRKKREMEKQRQEEKRKQQLKESQSRVLHKTQMLSAGTKGHGSIIGSHMGERRTTPLLGGERIENRLKKPTTFLCKLK